MTTATYTSQQQNLLQDMIAYLQNPDNWANGVPQITDFSPGSVAYTLLAAIAVGLDQIGLQYFNALQQSSVMTSTNPILDGIAANWGVTRKTSVAAFGNFNFIKNVAATTDIVIPAGTLITTAPASDMTTIQFKTDADVILHAGQTSVSVTATCSNPGPGSGGNMNANTQLFIGSATPGIDSVALSSDITNGIDAESDESLRSRVLEAMQNPPGPGSPTDYQEWALSVGGVASATVLPRNRGPGTVDVLITGTNSVAPNATLISEVQNVISTKAPADVDALVIGPAVVAVDVTVTVTLTSGYTLASVQSAVQTAVTNYINGVRPGSAVYNSRVVASAIGVTGVADAQVELSVNGITQMNILLTSSEAAQTGTITVQS